MRILPRALRGLASSLLLLTGALPVAAQGFTLTLADTNVARFIAKETFVGVELPFEPVGVTPGVTGSIVFGADGKVDAKASKITVDLTLLKTDNTSRDGQLKRQTLETTQYPNAVLVPTAITGLATPVPLDGTLSFTLIGDLTIRNVTKPTTWTVTATAKDGRYVGTAKTTIRFDQFELKKPTSMRVLSIVDELRLEYDFTMVRK